MGEPKSANAPDKLVRAVGGKFNSLVFGVYREERQSVVSIRHPEVACTIERQKCLEQKLKLMNEGIALTLRSSAIPKRRGQQQQGT